MAVVAQRSRTRSARIEALAGFALIAAPTAVLVILVLLPAAISVAGTFVVATDRGTTLGLARYGAFFADAYSRANLLFTIALTVTSTLSTLLVSIAIAIYLRFGTGRLAAYVQTLSLFPLFVPSIIVSYAMIRFLGPNGMLQILLERVGIHGFSTPYLTPFGPYIAYVWESLPIPVMVMTAGFAQVGDEAIEAARDLGAGWWRILTEILLPQAKRSIAVAFALPFLGIFGSFTVPSMLGPAAPEMMAVFMQRTFGQLNQPDEAQIQAVLSFLVCAAVGILYVRLVSESKR